MILSFKFFSAINKMSLMIISCCYAFNQVSFQCTGSPQSFFFDRTIYHSIVSVYIEGAAGGESSNCPGKVTINYLFILCVVHGKLWSPYSRWKGSIY
jgi:hypothetical protein